MFDVINALLGVENIANYSLTSLSHEYHRAKLANKLLNYSSEISTRLEADIFKRLTSGEPVEARLPYG
ncbi:MAG: DNA primase, partial [Acidobacteria bacterium]|nr:DNA primase [Acidobacteriota bacterium]